MRSSLLGVPYQHPISLPGVSMAQVSCSAKLSPVKLVETGGKPRPVPQGPLCSSTYVSIRSTCPDICAFKDNGCYAQTGSSRRIMKKLDEAHVPGTALAMNECRAINNAFGGGRVPQDGARGGRDLRLHVGGDVSGRIAAERVSFAVDYWKSRGGGVVWTYTHRWREIPVSSWGQIRAWASCETIRDAHYAHELGYRAAIVRTDHPSERLYGAGSPGVRILPCPFETRGKTCVECRLCLDAPIDKGIVIGFRAHGARDKAVSALNKRRLEVV